MNRTDIIPVANNLRNACVLLRAIQSDSKTKLSNVLPFENLSTNAAGIRNDQPAKLTRDWHKVILERRTHPTPIVIGLETNAQFSELRVHVPTSKLLFKQFYVRVDYRTCTSAD